jgi:transcriptional regulator with XRE-family HTH domain
MPSDSQKSALKTRQLADKTLATRVKKTNTRPTLKALPLPPPQIEQPQQKKAKATAKSSVEREEPSLYGPDIGRRIRNLRHIKGLTLKDLAVRTFCSESMLSKVENGKAQVSLTLLHRIVHSLDITITALFSESRADQGVVTRAKERSTFRIDAKGSRLERLIPPNLGHLLEGNLHILEPGGGSDGILMHEGEEVGYVLSGVLELTVSGVEYLLYDGDSFVYRSEEPHSYRNPGEVTTRVLWVSTPPTF